MLCKFKTLTNNQLKIIAMVTMLIDHVGKILLNYNPIFSAIGRISFPIFAYMIAEGCIYTKNHKRYFLTIFSMASVFQAVYFAISRSLYMNILFTFSLSIFTIYCINLFRKNKKFLPLLILEILAVIFISFFLPKILSHTDFTIDYGVLGVFLPVIIYLMPNKLTKLISTAVTLSIMALVSYNLKWFALLAIPLLAMYNGKRGKYNLKYMFYIFYPTHFVLLYLIDMVV